MHLIGNFSGSLHAFEADGCAVAQAILRMSDTRELSVELRGPCAALGLVPRDVVQINLVESEGRYTGTLSGRSGAFKGSGSVEGRFYQAGETGVFVGRIAIARLSFGLLLDLEKADD